MLLEAQVGTARMGPKPSALGGSLVLHGALIGWAFFGPPLGTRIPPEQPKNAYQQLIAGNEKKLVWYHFRDKLPQVSPLERHGISRPPRSESKTAKQTIVANPPKARKAKQMVYLPAPPKELEREVQSPNLFAFAVPKLARPEAQAQPPVKLFAPPPEVLRTLTPPEPLPDAPQVAANMAKPDLPPPDALARPKPKEFVPPEEAKREPAPQPLMPDAPKVPGASASVSLPEPQRLRAREFVPPQEVKRLTADPPTVPEAPKVAAVQQSPRLSLRTFVPPRESKQPAAAPAVPDAPRVAAATARVDLPPPQRLRPRDFVPPQPARRASVSPGAVPDVPQVSSTTAKLTLPPAPKLPPRKFVPPVEMKPSTSRASAMPDAPRVAATSGGVDLPPPQQLGARTFVPPRAKPSPSTGAALPDAPPVSGAAGGGGLSRSFVPPAEPPRRADGAPQVESPPALDSAPSGGSFTAAIVGLNPAEELKALPEGARAAAFSSAPKPSADGGSGEPVESAKLFVPDLMIRDGAMREPDATLAKGITKMASIAPTSTENLIEAARSAPRVPPETRLPGIAQVPDAPDPRFSGRTIYMASIQMPNVTSFIGSWIMWFADHEPMPGQVREMRAPVPVRKVDPKYVASAAAERVQGKVQLSGVIRRDGHVDSITVLKHLDDRLDFSATEALAKWEFEPARRDGRPVDVDAVFEIPFRLEPVTSR